MKKILLIILLLSPCIGYSQDQCSKIEVYKDEFRNFTSFSTPYDLQSIRAIGFDKIVEPGKKPTYYLKVREHDVMGKTVPGLFLILKNGQRISRPRAEINVDVDPEEQSILHPGYIVSCTIQLTTSELLLLKSSAIQKYAFTILKNDVHNPDDLFAQLICLFDKK